MTSLVVRSVIGTRFRPATCPGITEIEGHLRTTVLRLVCGKVDHRNVVIVAVSHFQRCNSDTDEVRFVLFWSATSAPI